MADDTRERHLLERPQRLGILPTWWWFWNDRDNWKLVRWPFAGFVFALALILAALSLARRGACGLPRHVLLVARVSREVRPAPSSEGRELADARATKALES